MAIMAKLNGKKVAILATDLTEESEIIDTKKALDAAGATTVVIAPHAGEIQLVQHDKKTQNLAVDQTLAEADPGEFDAALLPGGAMNADALRVEQEAQEFVRTIDEAGKPLAVICHAPWLLVSAGLAAGRKLTSYHTIADDLRNAGAEWSDREVVVDNNLVTSRQPDDIPAFNQAFMEVLQNHSPI